MLWLVTKLKTIWVLLSSKPGDNAQILRLAEASRLPFETKQIVLKPPFELAKPAVEPSLHHVNLEASAPLQPPWPDAVLSIGRRMAMVALWIKQQSPDTHVVQIGPPKRHADQFSLLVVPLQYRLGDGANLCRIGLPLLGVDAHRVEAEATKKAGQFASLPKPLTVFLAGGSTGTHSLDPERAMEIISIAQDHVRRDGGSLYVSTSRRTPEESVRAMQETLPTGAGFYRWRPGDADNPYLALLGHGDRFIVTGDSISMLVEVARLGKPLAIAGLRPANRSVAQMLAKFHAPVGLKWRLARLAGQLVARTPWGSGSGTRDFALLHEVLYRHQWAVKLGEDFRTAPFPPPDDAAIAGQRLRALLGEDQRGA